MADPRELRNQRILAEINQLQSRLKNNGYKCDGSETFDFDTIPGEHIDWIIRIWFLGYALHRPSMKGF